MSQGSSMQILSILKAQGFDVQNHPGNADAIDQAGYYFNSEACQIEHWSTECEYNKVLGFHNCKNANGLIRDGWQSILPFEDVEGLIQSIEVWDRHLIRYGVKK